MAKDDGSTFDKPASLEYYWRDVIWLVGDAGAYARAYKLNNNLCNPEQRHVVWPTFLRYYKGDFGKLNATIAERRKECLCDINAINARLSGFGLARVEVPEQLLNMLLDADRRDRYKSYAKRHSEKHELLSLDELEQEYQHRPRRGKKT